MKRNNEGMLLKALGQYVYMYKGHPVINLTRHSRSKYIHAEERKFNHMAVYTATRTYVCSKILAPLVLQSAPSLVCTFLHHCQHVRTMPYTGTAKRLNSRMEDGASEWHSF